MIRKWINTSTLALVTVLASSGCGAAYLSYIVHTDVSDVQPKCPTLSNTNLMTTDRYSSTKRVGSSGQSPSNESGPENDVSDMESLFEHIPTGTNRTLDFHYGVNLEVMPIAIMVGDRLTDDNIRR